MGRAAKRQAPVRLANADAALHHVYIDSGFAQLRAAAKKLGPHRAAPALARLTRAVARVVHRDPGIENRPVQPGSTLPWVSAEVVASLGAMNLDRADDPTEADIPVLELGYDFRLEPDDEINVCHLIRDTAAEGRGQSQIPPKLTRARDAFRDRYRAAVAANPALITVDFSVLEYGGRIADLNRGSATVEELWICYNAWLGRMPIRQHYELGIAKKVLSRDQFGRALRDGDRRRSVRGSGADSALLAGAGAGAGAGTPLWAAVYLAPGGPTLERGAVRLATVGTGAVLPAALSAAEAGIWGPAYQPRAVSDAGGDLGAVVKRALLQFPRCAAAAASLRMLETDHGAALASVAAVPIELIAVDPATHLIQSRTVVQTSVAIGTVFPARGFYANADAVHRFVAERAAVTGDAKTARRYQFPEATVAALRKRYSGGAFSTISEGVSRTLRLRTGVDDPAVPAVAEQREAAAAGLAAILWEERLPLLWPGRPVFQQIDLATTLPVKPRTKGYGARDRPASAESHLVSNLSGAAVNFGWSHSVHLKPFLKKRGSGRDLTKLSIDELVTRLRQIPERFASRESRARAFENVDDLVAETQALLGRVRRSGGRLGNERYEAVRLINRSMVAVDTHARHDQTSCGPQRLRVSAAQRALATAVLLEAKTLVPAAGLSVPPPDLNRAFGFSFVTARPDAEWRAALDRPVTIAVNGVTVVESGSEAPGSPARLAAGYVAELLRDAAAASRDTAVLLGSRRVAVADDVDRLEREALTRRIHARVDMLRASLSPALFKLVAARFGLVEV